MSASAYAKRQATVAKIPTFWNLVIEQAPLDIDQYVQPHDSRVFGEFFKSLDVDRFEIARGPEAIAAGASAGNPRSIAIKFEFEENFYFEDTVLEKKFWYRRSSDGWTGLVSEPVKITWKKGQDLTEGLTDLAVALWEARKEAGDMKKKDLPEYTAMKKKAEHWNGMNTSFFTWFAWVSQRRWVSAEESEQAVAKHQERKDKVKRGEKVEPDEPDKEDDEDEDDFSEQEVEAHEHGEELAISFAEDLWPGAIKYFTQAQEMDEMSLSDDFETDEDEEDGEDTPVDIRSLVQGKDRDRSDPQQSDAPPAKKQKKGPR